MPFAKMPKTNRRTDILPNLVAVFRMILHYKFLYHIPSEDFHKWPEQKIYFLNFRTGTYDLVLADPGHIVPVWLV